MTALKEARLKSGLKQKDVADMFGIPLRTLQNWEAGARVAPDYVTERLFKALSSMSEYKQYAVAVVEYNGGSERFITICKTKEEAVKEAENQWKKAGERYQKSRIVAGIIQVFDVRGNTIYGDMQEVYTEHR